MEEDHRLVNPKNGRWNMDEDDSGALSFMINTDSQNWQETQIQLPLAGLQMTTADLTIDGSLPSLPEV